MLVALVAFPVFLTVDAVADNFVIAWGVMVDRRGFLLPLAPVMVLYDFGGSRLCRWFVIWDRTAKFVCHGHAYGYVTTVD